MASEPPQVLYVIISLSAPRVCIYTLIVIYLIINCKKIFTHLSNRFFIQLQDFGVHSLSFVDVLLYWIRIVLVWRHISGQSQFYNSLFTCQYSYLLFDLFSADRQWLWLYQWFVLPECVFAQIRSYRNTINWIKLFFQKQIIFYVEEMMIRWNHLKNLFIIYR